MLETTTKIWMVGGTVVITVPGGILNDSTFPFYINYKDNQKTKSIDPFSVKIKINKDKLIIEKSKEADKK